MENLPDFNAREEVYRHHEKKYGVKAVDRTKEPEGKAVVFLPGPHSTRDPEDE